ncbi:hypothetical protein [Kitasatospora sp. GAS1066B]
MYLIHAKLRPPAVGVDLPPRLAALLGAMTVPEDRLEHIAVHPDAVPYPTLGLYLMADSLREAEQRAQRLGRRWVTDVSPLRGWQLVSAEAPLVAPFYDRLLSSSGLGGLIGPGPLPSS